MEKIARIEDISVHPCTNSRYVQPFRVAYKQDGLQKYWDCIKMHDSVGTLIFNRTRETFVLVRQFRPPVYMSQHRNLWENSSVFTNTLSEQPHADHQDDCTTHSQEDDQPPPAKRSALAEKDADDCDTSEANSPKEYSNGSFGCTYELCAGLVDKKTSLAKIAKAEVLEETGYNVPLDGMEYVTSYYSSIGTGGSRQTVFYCEVTDGMLEADGGGNRHEGEMIDVYHLPIAEADEFVFDASKPKSTGLCFSFLWFDKFKKPHLKSQ